MRIRQQGGRRGEGKKKGKRKRRGRRISEIEGKIRRKKT